MSKELKQTFLQKQYTNGQTAYKWMLDINNYTNANKPVRYHLTPIKMAKIRKTENGVDKDVEKLKFLCPVSGNTKQVQQLWKIEEFLKNLMKLQHLAIPLQGRYLKELKSYLRETFAHLIHSSIIQNSQEMETTQKSIMDEWICKMLYTHK